MQNLDEQSQNAKANIQQQPQQPPEKDLSGATLAALADLETALKASIEKLPNDALKDELTKKVDTNNQIVTEASLAALDDKDATNKKVQRPVLKDQSRGLSAFHKKEASEYIQKLNEQQMEKELASEIIQNLLKVQEMRKDILAKYLKEQEAEHSEPAYDDLMRQLYPKNLQAKVKEDNKPVGSKLLSHIMQQPNNMILGENGKDFVHYDGQSLTASNPTLLGMAAAASGAKSIELSGPPWAVLTAAKQALANGVQTVSISEGTLKNIQSPSAYKSWSEYMRAKADLEYIMDRSTKNKMLSDSKKNQAFDNSPKSRISQLQETFNALSPDKDHYNHECFIKSLSTSDQIALAEQMKDSNYPYQNRVVNGKDYVKSLATRNLNTISKGFVEDGFMNHEIGQLKTKLSGKSTDEIATEISKLDKAKRNEIYKKDMDGFFNASEDKKQLKAALLGATIDRAIENELGSMAFTNDVTKILQEPSLEELAEIRDIFNAKYNRLQIKWDNHVEDSGLDQQDENYEKTKDKKLRNVDDDFIELQEGKGDQDIILDSQKKVNLYYEYSTIVNKYFEGQLGKLAKDELAISNKQLGKPAKDELTISNKPLELLDTDNDESPSKSMNFS